MIDVNVFVNEINLPPKRTELHTPTILHVLSGLQALLFKKRFPAKMKTWLISTHLYRKCTYTELKLRETMLELTDAL